MTLQHQIQRRGVLILWGRPQERRENDLGIERIDDIELVDR